MTTTPKRLLFVCMGNICRSPAAECIFRHKSKLAGLEDSFICDSAGTIGFHEGSAPDRRMTHAARKKEYILEGSSRPLRSSDFKDFDMIIAMDEENFNDICSRAQSDKDREKVVMMCDYAQNHSARIVPDPYYGGQNGFDNVIDLLDDACEGLLASLRKQ